MIVHLTFHDRPCREICKFVCVTVSNDFSAKAQGLTTGPLFELTAAGAVSVCLEKNYNSQLEKLSPPWTLTPS
jgi:hypothetical protein